MRKLFADPAWPPGRLNLTDLRTADFHLIESQRSAGGSTGQRMTSTVIGCPMKRDPRFIDHSMPYRDTHGSTNAILGHCAYSQPRETYGCLSISGSPSWIRPSPDARSTPSSLRSGLRLRRSTRAGHRHPTSLRRRHPSDQPEGRSLVAFIPQLAQHEHMPTKTARTRSMRPSVPGGGIDGRMNAQERAAVTRRRRLGLRGPSRPRRASRTPRRCRPSPRTGSRRAR